MKRLPELIVEILILTGITACTDNVVNVGTPAYKQKLVVQSVISPTDSVIVATMDYNYPVYGEIKHDDIITHNPKLSLSDGLHEEMFALKNDTFYLKPSSFVLQAGHVYYLKGSDDAGNIVEATTQIPMLRDNHIRWDTTTIYGSQDQVPLYLFKSEIRFTDYPGEANFYHLRLISEVYYQYYSVPPEILENTIYTDRFSDGSEMLLSTVIPVMNYISSDSAFLNLYFEQINEEYYTFIKSLKNYSDSEDPFSEITPVYSNIDGGLGIFGGMNLQVYRLRIK